MTDWRHSRSLGIKRDLILSALIGPAQTIVTVLAHILIYPLILSRSGIEVLGLWGLIATLSAYVNLADAGFSSLFVRDIGSATSTAQWPATARHRIIARRSYVIVVCALIISWLLVAYVVLNPEVFTVYPRDALALAVVVQLLGIALTIDAKLDGALLTGLNRTWLVQSVEGAVPMLRYGIAMIGALMAKPIEGFAIGTLLGALCQWLMFRHLVRRHAPELVAAHPAIGLRETVGGWLSLFRRGSVFYSISVGFVLREPVFRAVIASTLGLAAVGIYEIASRVPQAIRAIVVSSDRSLFPSFAHLYASGNRKDIQLLVVRSLSVYVGCGISALSIYWILAPMFLPLWLGTASVELIEATQVITFFWMMTVFNVPYWHLLQACGEEKAAAQSLWIQTIAVLLLIPASQVVELSLIKVLWYWNGTALLAQISIYARAQRALRIVRPTLLTTHMLAMVCALAGAALASSLLTSQNIYHSEPAISSFFHSLAVCCTAFTVMIFPFFRREATHLLQVTHNVFSRERGS